MPGDNPLLPAAPDVGFGVIGIVFGLVFLGALAFIVVIAVVLVRRLRSGVPIEPESPEARRQRELQGGSNFAMQQSQQLVRQMQQDALQQQIIQQQNTQQQIQDTMRGHP